MYVSLASSVSRISFCVLGDGRWSCCVPVLVTGLCLSSVGPVWLVFCFGACLTALVAVDGSC